MAEKSQMIGIFSKFHVSGGSEMRCVELANAIRTYTPYESCLLCEGRMGKELKKLVNGDVPIYEHLFIDKTDEEMHEKLYGLRHLLVVNTDSKQFTTLDYWSGKSETHKTEVDLTRIPSMAFLFNYLISPSKRLVEIEPYCPRIKIITTNTKFFQEIPKKYEGVIHFPRMILESPINPDRVSNIKIMSNKIRIGCHSKPVRNKWGEDWPKLIEYINNVIGEDKVEWRFLGCPGDFEESLKDFKNVECHREFTVGVKNFLMEVDLFVFYPSWGREEPWSRVVAEALLSGAPVIASNRGGNLDQIVHGNNGFLCANLEDFQKYVTLLCQNKYMLTSMRNICIKKSQYFTSPQVVRRFVDFLEW